jgi:chloride channel protein, CIC family
VASSDPRRPPPLAVAELRTLLDRSREVVVVSAVLGAVVGLGVAVFEQGAAEGLLEEVLSARPWVQVLAPAVGLLLSALALRYLARDPSQATTDVYVQAMPDRRAPFPTRPYLGRLAAAFATLGLGGAGGYEGPALYLGAGAGPS